jgi:signal peptidase I
VGRLLPLLVLVLSVAACGGGEKIFRMPSAAMEPTIHCAHPHPGCEANADDEVVVKMSGSEGVHRGDIVMYESPPEAQIRCGTEGGKYLKRVIGLSGEKIDLSSTGLHVNGKSVLEPYLKGRELRSINFGSWSVEPGTYFLMGDNRDASCDSRFYGGVPKDNILGKVTAIKRGTQSINVE